MKSVLKLIVSIIICEGAGILGSIFTTPAVQSSWYVLLTKPAFFPPNSIFGPVWSILYALMGISLFLVWKNNFAVRNDFLSAHRKAWNPYSERFWVGDWQKVNIIAVFCIQLFLNVLWSIIFFGMRNAGLAFFELIALWFSIIYLIANFYRVSKASAWFLAPYLLWVTFALYLNFSIWVLNL